MLAVLYLILTIIFGCSLVLKLCDTTKLFASYDFDNSKNAFLKKIFILTAGSTIGILVITFFSYYTIYFLNNFFPYIKDYNYNIGITITFILFTILTIFNLKKYKFKKIINFKNNIFYLSSIIILIILTTFLMFYTYHIKGNYLMVGPTTSSDMSPHTAMVSSFGIGSNIPTSYMHFADDGIRYHFFFYFYSGTLKYLGMPIDYAINIPSILTMVTALSLAGLLTVLISKRRLGFILTPLLILFRSSLNFFIYLKDLMINHENIFNTILNMSKWYDTTPYDNWGIWAINVYPNQRHLMLGMAIILILIIIFIPYIKELFSKLKELKLKDKFKYFFLANDNWSYDIQSKDLILALIMVVCTPYFHGSALITALIILAGIAIISSKRLMYLLIAVASILSSSIQTMILSGGNVINFKYNPGFIVQDKSMMGILNYLFIVTGFMIIIALIYCIKKCKEEKYLLFLFIIFLLPIIFAFSFQITIEMLANHKFIQFSIILLDILVGAFLAELFMKKHKFFSNIIIGLILTFTLTITGITEWIIYFNLNKHKTSININAPYIEWIKNNTNKDAIFITPMWSMHSFFLSGRASYYGWPYYAWSAGHDTNKRCDEIGLLLSSMNNNIDAFINYCKEHHVKYLIYSPDIQDFEFRNNTFYNEKFINDNLKLLIEFPDDHIKIYQIY